MSSKSPKIIIGLISVILLMGVGLCFVLNQPKYVAGLAFYLLRSSSSELLVKEITIEKIQWFSWNKLKLSNVKIKCNVKEVSYSFSVGDVDIDHLNALIDGKPMQISVKALALASESLNIWDIQTQIQAYFNFFHYHHLEALVKSPRLDWNRYLLEDVQAKLEDNGKQLEFSDIRGKLYGGTIQLKGAFNYAQPIAYNADIQLIQVNSSSMAEANEVFSELSAVVDGTIKMQNSKAHGLSIQADLKAPLGGLMKASLLQFLAQYVPQRKQIEDLIHQNAKISLDKMEAQITSVSRDALSSDIVLNSFSLNLNMKVKFDIHVEGGLDHLLEYIHK